MLQDFLNDEEFENESGDGISINFDNQVTPSISRSSSLYMLLSKISFSRQNLNSICDKNNFWIEIFNEAFFANAECIYRDDLLFFVIKPDNETAPDLKVFRRSSRHIPGNDDKFVDWEQTVYLNLIMQYFTYVLTVAVVTRTGPQEYQILRKVSEKVYASPSKRQMDSKGTEEEMAYPNIYFSVDNFEEVFSSCVVRDSESVCFELTAYDQKGYLQGVIFIGTVRYGTLKNVYDSRKNSLSNRIVKQTANWFRMTKDLEFIKMLGPDGKGHAQVAISAINSVNGSEQQIYRDLNSRTSYGRGLMSTSFTNGPVSSSVEGSPVRRTSEDHTADKSQRNLTRKGSKVADIVAGGKLVKNVLNTKMKKSQSDGGTFDGLNLNEYSDYSEPDSSIFSEDFDEYSQMTSSWGQSFSQAWYWFKERRKASSVALNASVTCISLPWHRIIADVLDTKTKPILTFDTFFSQ